MDKQPQKTKICTSCGIRKPLSNFVKDPSKRHKEYSDICQSCRGTKQKASLDDEEDGGKGRQLSIDYFAKRFMEELHENWLEKQNEQSESETLSSEEKDEAEKTEKETDETKETGLSEAEKAEPSDIPKSTFSSKISSAIFGTFGLGTETKSSSQATSAPETERASAKQESERTATDINKAETDKTKTTDKQTQDQKNKTTTTITEKENPASTLFQKEKNIITKAAGANTNAGIAEVNRHTRTVEKFYKAPQTPKIFKNQSPDTPKENAASKTEERIITPTKK